MEFGEAGEGTDVGCSVDGRGTTRSPGWDEAVSTLIEDTASSGQSARLYPRLPTQRLFPFAWGSLIRRTCRRETGVESLDRYRQLGLKAVEAEREQLETLREKDRIGPDAYLGLQEHLDWSELTLLRDVDRRIEEI